MRTWPCILLIFLLVAAAAPPCAAQENARRFISAMEAYKSRQYAAAAEELEAIAQSGVRNGQLYYNLGNAYLKNGDLGRAILWYERALKLMPSDPDLKFNLDYARSLTRDAKEEASASLVRIFFFWKYQLSSRAVLLSAMAFNLIFWCLLTAYGLTRRRALRHAAAIALMPAVVFVFTAAFNYHEAAHQRRAVVLNAQVAVRSGLESTSTELFVLHAGARVKVLKQMPGHCQIRFSKDKIGWVENSVVGVI